MEPKIIDNSFTVQPNDSIIAWQTNYKRDGLNPQVWFREFKIFPINGIELNDPKKAENLIKS